LKCIIAAFSIRVVLLFYGANKYQSTMNFIKSTRVSRVVNTTVCQDGD